MSYFSDKLRDAVAASGIPVSRIAEQSGVSSAMLYKIQSGSRLPDSTETLEQILTVIHCSLPQKQTLRQEYLICRIGIHRYNSFQELKSMLSAFVTPPLTAPELHYDPSMQPGPVITGETNVLTVLLQLLDREIRQPGGSVQMFLDLQFSSCFSALRQVLSRCHREFGTVTHLFCLKATAANDAILHNMKIFRDVLPQMAGMAHYDPRYCYLPDPNDGTVPFPYYIITSEGVLLLSGDGQNAVYLTDGDIRQQYQQEFCRLAKNFSPSMQAGSASMETYFHGFHRIIGRHNPSPIRPSIIAASPCILPCSAPETALAYLPPEVLQQSELMDIAAEYFEGAARNGYETFYTLESLEHVVKTGEIMELQGDFIPRARQEDILDCLEEFIRRARAGNVVPRVFKTNLIPVTSRFSMSLRGSELMLYCEVSHAQAVYNIGRGYPGHRGFRICDLCGAAGRRVFRGREHCPDRAAPAEIPQINLIPFSITIYRRPDAGLHPAFELFGTDIIENTCRSPAGVLSLGDMELQGAPAVPQSPKMKENILKKYCFFS